MNDLDSRQTIKSHNEIIDIIDEIREFEDEKDNLDLNFKLKEKNEKENIIEVEHKVLKCENEILENNKKNRFLKKIHFTTNPKERKKIEKMVIPTTFNIGFNENGDLTNLNLRKNKVKKKNYFSKIKGLIIKKKEDESNEKDSSSKIGKIKSKLNFLSKLTRILPIKSKNIEEQNTEE